MSTLATSIPTSPTMLPGARFRDGPHLPEMIVVPAGRFDMGANETNDKFASVVEKPRHQVEIPQAFGIGRFPVTFEEWDAFAEGNNEEHQPDDRGWGRGRLPVFNVSWEDAQAYLSWLSANTGRWYRLLSEAEWEYCCRAGSTGVFTAGNDLTIKDANFLYMDFGDRPGKGCPMPVGSFQPNAFGLCDMLGNVSELVADEWHDSFAGAPADGSVWGEFSPSMWRVVRGGGWDGLPRILRAAFRDWVYHHQRLDNMGFRVACNLD
jgi:formylglycine-generating enzyme required for sulfatase activity